MQNLFIYGLYAIFTVDMKNNDTRVTTRSVITSICVPLPYFPFMDLTAKILMRNVQRFRMPLFRAVQAFHKKLTNIGDL